MTSERWFVYEWSDLAGEPNIIAWCETRRAAERELESAVALANRELAFGKKDRIIGTEYALCHVEQEIVIKKKHEEVK